MYLETESHVATDDMDQSGIQDIAGRTMGALIIRAHAPQNLWVLIGI